MARPAHARAFPLALLVAVVAAPAAAQTGPQTTREPTELEAITVVAPRITYQGVRRERGSAIPKEVTIAEKSAQVSYADLDLSRSADLFTLEQRVEQAAARVCEELAQQFPEGEPSTAVCTKRAIDDAMPMVRAASRNARSARASSSR